MTRFDRLREIVAGSGFCASHASSVSPEEAAGPHEPSPPALEVLGGRLEIGPDGPSFVIERRYDEAEKYGHLPLGEYPALSGDALGVLVGCDLERETADDLRRVVCLDLETTGLSGGAGTVGFIIGLGWFEPGGFRTSQYFLNSLTDERCTLAAVTDVLARAHTVITFNGKSFDLPVLETR